MKILMKTLGDVPEERTHMMFGEYAVYVGDKVVAFVCAMTGC